MRSRWEPGKHGVELTYSPTDTVFNGVREELTLTVCGPSGGYKCNAP